LSEFMLTVSQFYIMGNSVSNCALGNRYASFLCLASFHFTAFG
jgi:hypothetical protein